MKATISYNSKEFQTLHHWWWEEGLQGWKWELYFVSRLYWKQASFQVKSQTERFFTVLYSDWKTVYLSNIVRCSCAVIKSDRHLSGGVINACWLIWSYMWRRNSATCLCYSNHMLYVTCTLPDPMLFLYTMYSRVCANTRKTSPHLQRRHV